MWAESELLEVNDTLSNNRKDKRKGNMTYMTIYANECVTCVRLIPGLLLVCTIILPPNYEPAVFVYQGKGWRLNV